MGSIEGLTCLYCGSPHGADLITCGCPVCRTDDFVSNLSCVYDLGALRGQVRRELFRDGRAGVWRYDALLPLDADRAVTLGEGNTALVPASSVAERVGLRHLWIKDETRNPTLSFKDRLCSVAVSYARAHGAPAITVSSTGNHGAATAAYAARAGLPCVIFTVPHAPPNMKLLMQAYGAAVVATPTYQDRWTLMSQCIDRLGWFPTGNLTFPPSGSTPYGVEGHKTIAFEICEQLDWRVPDWVVLPVAFGDGLYGVWKGFREFRDLGLIDRVPRMVAAETHGPLAHALRAGLDRPQTVAHRETVAISIGSPWGTYQALRALRDSEGVAAAVSDEEILDAQALLSRAEGLFVEASSAACAAALQTLAGQGVIHPDDTVVAVVTSTGLKDPQPITGRLPEVPVIEPRMGALREAVQVYGLTLNIPGD